MTEVLVADLLLEDGAVLLVSALTEDFERWAVKSYLVKDGEVGAVTPCADVDASPGDVGRRAARIALDHLIFLGYQGWARLIRAGLVGREELDDALQAANRSSLLRGHLSPEAVQ